MRAAKSGALTDIFTGAPLDVVKLAAAGLMVIDHVNVVFLDHESNLLWRLGRISLPLFSFALACNLQRGIDASRYIGMLLLLGAVSQPICAAVLGNDRGNILFTLAVGAAILTALRPRPPWLQHLVLLAGVAAVFSPFAQAQSGLDYGVAGMLFPAALLLVMDGRLSHMVWLVLLLIGLNWFYPNPWQYAPARSALFAGFGSIAILGLAMAFRNRPRFLPRYALHVFYPGHLLLLAAIRGLA